MRTKTLVLAAVLSAAGIASSLAQVYSVNAVGYVNVACNPGFSLIANPLDNKAGNQVSALFAGVPEGTTVYKFDATSGSYAINTYEFGEWTVPTMPVEPGEGVFIRNAGTAAFTVTFVGEVKQGTLQDLIPPGFSIQSSQVPQAGKIATDLLFPAAEGDTVYRFANATQAYVIATFEFGEWTGGEPTVAVGESFFVKKTTGASWNRTFSVNQ